MQLWTALLKTHIFPFLLASFIGMATLTSCQSSYCRNTAIGPEMHPSQKVVDIFFPGDTYRHVIPYEVNLYGIYIFEKDLNWRDVETYILWYFNHLNYPDKHGLPGSIYDYMLDGQGRETSTTGYDSADAYAATFLMLLNAYYQKVGNREILNYYRKNIEDIASLIIFLKNENGLTRASPDLDAMYLMDNCEVYAGLKAYVALSQEIGWTIPGIYHEAVDEIRQGIWTKLYNASNDTFHWALYGETVHTSNWRRFYPDSLAQLFPILYDLVDPSSLQARRIWNKFHSRYGMGGEDADHLQTVLISMVRDRIYLTEFTSTHKEGGVDFRHKP